MRLYEPEEKTAREKEIYEATGMHVDLVGVIEFDWEGEDAQPLQPNGDA